MKANYTVGALTIWFGMVVIAISMIMSDVKLGYNMLTGFYGFSIIVYGFYLNHRNANPKHKDGSGTGGSESGGNSGGGGDAGDTKEAIRIGVDGVVGGDV